MIFGKNFHQSSHPRGMAHAPGQSTAKNGFVSDLIRIQNNLIEITAKLKTNLKMMVVNIRYYIFKTNKTLIHISFSF